MQVRQAPQVRGSRLEKPEHHAPQSRPRGSLLRHAGHSTSKLLRVEQYYFGIDLAADPAKTGTALIQVTPAGPLLIDATCTATDDHLVLMLVENTQRRDLNPMERAEAYDALRNMGLAPGEIVKAKVTDYQNYDLVAEVPKEKRRSLTIV